MTKRYMPTFNARVKIANFLVNSAETEELDGKTIPEILTLVKAYTGDKAVTQPTVESIIVAMDIKWKRPEKMSEVAKLRLEVDRLNLENASHEETIRLLMEEFAMLKVSDVSHFDNGPAQTKDVAGHAV
jgi:hypothetical protein